MEVRKETQSNDTAILIYNYIFIINRITILYVYYYTYKTTHYPPFNTLHMNTYIYII